MVTATRVKNERPRFETDERSRVDLIRKFVNASYARDEKTLMSIFADDVQLTSDGGGKVHAARRIVFGSERILRVEPVEGEPALTAAFDQWLKGA